MPAQSLVFVAAEENIRQTDRLEDDLYPTSQYIALVHLLIRLSINHHESLTLHFNGRPLTL